MEKIKETLAATILLVVFLTASYVTSFANPDIQLEETERDFGEVEPDEKVMHTFNFKNAGDEPLIISAAPGCSCTKVELSSKEISPGENGWVKVTFDTEGRQGKTAQVISISSNDPDELIVKLLLTGFVRREIIVSLRRVYFDQFFRDNPSRREVYLLKGKDKDFKIVKIGADSEYIEYYGPTPVFRDNTSGYLINVSLAPDVPIGRFNGNLKVYTDSKEQGVVTIGVSANVEREVKE